MHGHGARPNLCHYVDCERSVTGHGFPRRYNLFDHMRRVHGWQGDKEEASTSMDGPGSGSRKARGQKRKVASGSTGDKKVEKKMKVNKAAQQQQQRDRQRARLSQEWSLKKQTIADFLANLNELSELSEADNSRLIKDFTEFCAFREKYQGAKEPLAD